jgi:two-component system sensor histidine kinase QseC
MNMSLRRFFLLILLGGVTLWWGLVTFWVYREAAHEVEEIYDANLAQTARALLSITEFTHEDEEEQHSFDLYAQGAGHHYEIKIAFMLTDQHGRILLQSPSAPNFTQLRQTDDVPSIWSMLTQVHDDDDDDEYDEADDEAEEAAKSTLERPYPLPKGEQTKTVLPLASEGFRTVYDDEHYWRVFSLWDTEHGVLVQTGERYEVRREMIWEILESVLHPLLYALPLLGFLIWFGVGLGLRPLQNLSSDIRRRDPKQLDPLQENAIPQEIRPLTDALNQLFARLAQAFDNERRFTSDAAHELRTPLAGIRIQVEVARRSNDDAQRHTALAHIEQGVERATRLVEQLLALARMDAQQDSPMQTVDLHALAAQTMSELWPVARDKHIELSLEGDSVSRAVNPDAIAVLLRNLIDNALRYTPSGGQVSVDVSPDAVWVRDTGPGIPAAERERIFERFRRGKHQNIQGSGLGLSIVKRIADLHGAELRVTTGIDNRGLAIGCLFLAAEP